MFQNMSIRVKLLISYLCVTLIPIIVFGMIMTGWLRETTMDKAIQEAQESSARVEERIQSLLSTVNEVSNRLCVDEELYQIATTQFESPLECIKALNDYQTFQEYENTYPEIDVIKFYVQNDTLLNSGHFISPGPRDLHSLWYSQAKRNNGKVQWWYMSDESYGDSRLALIRSLYNYGKYTIDTDVVNDDYKVIPYILQPIVENSIIHGMEEQRQKTSIALKAYFQENQLVLKVADDGVGMTQEKLQELRQRLEVPLGSTATHIGLRNVHQRIRFHYGPEYGLKIESEYNQGTVVKICLPGVLS